MAATQWHTCSRHANARANRNVSIQNRTTALCHTLQRATHRVPSGSQSKPKAFSDAPIRLEETCVQESRRKCTWRFARRTSALPPRQYLRTRNLQCWTDQHPDSTTELTRQVCLPKALASHRTSCMTNWMAGRPAIWVRAKIEGAGKTADLGMTSDTWLFSEEVCSVRDLAVSCVISVWHHS